MPARELGRHASKCAGAWAISGGRIRLCLADLARMHCRGRGTYASSVWQRFVRYVLERRWQEDCAEGQGLVEELCEAACGVAATLDGVIQG